MRAMAVIVTTSCSFVTVRGPAAPPAPPGDCTRASSAPGLDTAGAVLGVVGMLAGGWIFHDAGTCSQLHPPGYNSEQCLGEAGIGVLVFAPSALAALAYTISAVHGSHQIEECNARLAPPPPPRPAAEMALPHTWFCTESETEGVCKPSREQCEAFRARSSHALSACGERTSAACFEVGTELHCSPNMEICGTLRAAAERLASAPVSACDVRRSATLVPPVDRSAP